MFLETFFMQNEFWDSRPPIHPIVVSRKRDSFIRAPREAYKKCQQNTKVRLKSNLESQRYLNVFRSSFFMYRDHLLRLLMSGIRVNTIQKRRTGKYKVSSTGFRTALPSDIHGTHRILGELLVLGKFCAVVYIYNDVNKYLSRFANQKSPFAINPGTFARNRR